MTKEQLIEQYKLGKSISEISLEFFKSSNTLRINNLNKKYNIDPSDYNDAYKYTNKEWLQKQFDLYKTPSAVSNNTGIPRTCITRYATKFGIYSSKFSRQSKNEINEDYFENIDCEDKAYWLGFIMADGNIYKYKNSDKIQFSIKIKQTDHDHLVKFAKSIGFNKSKIKKGHALRNKTMCYFSEIRSYNKVFCENLMKHGIEERKSGKEILPETIPEEFIKDFIRGFIDGDGTISEKFIRIYSTSKKIIDDISKYLTKKEFVHSIVGNSRMYAVNILKESQIDFLKFLNYENSVSLSRKCEIVKNIIRPQCE